MSLSFPGGFLYWRGGHLLKTCGGQLTINLDQFFLHFFSGWCSTVNSGSAGPAYGACQDCPHRTPWQVGCLHDDRHHPCTLEQFIFIFLISLTDLGLVSNSLPREMNITLKCQAGFIWISEIFI